jgi:hypothetical protein
MVPSKPQTLKGIKEHEVEATAPIHDSFVELGRPDQRVDYEEKPIGLGMLSVWSKVIKDSDQCKYSRTVGLTTLIAQLVRLILRRDSWGAGPL